MISTADFLSRGYLPKELPPPFNSDSFGNFVVLHFGIAKSLLSSGSETLLARHSLSRAGDLRRQLSVPNPLAFLGLADCLASDWTDVEAQFARSSVSISRAQPMSSGRAVVAATPFSDQPLHQAELRSSSRFILKTDISNCYPSIYTHSISWALNGKSNAKANRKKKNLGNRLDTLVRNGQYGQTIGLPIGPDTSFVVAEMLLSSIDEAFCSVLKKHKITPNGFRSYDDFEFGFYSRSDAERAVAFLQEVLSNYELQLNSNKTSIVELPIPFEYAWVSELRMFPLDDSSTSWGLRRYFDRSFELSRESPDKEVLKYAIQRLRAIDIAPDCWPLVEKLLLQCAVVEPSALPAVVDHLHFYRDKGLALSTAKVQEVLNLLISWHAPLGHGSEVAWSLWGCLLFGLPIEVSSSGAAAQMEDAFVSLLLLDAEDSGLIKGKLSRARWIGHMKKEGLRDELWPLAYEANVQGWDKSKSDYVRRDGEFNLLKSHNVSFYDATKKSTHSPVVRRGSPWATGGGGGGYPDGMGPVL